MTHLGTTYHSNVVFIAIRTPDNRDVITVNKHYLTVVILSSMANAWAIKKRFFMYICNVWNVISANIVVYHVLNCALSFYLQGEL